MIVATVVRDPQPPIIYSFLGVLMLTAMIKGTRINRPSKGRIGWLEDAWSGLAGWWIVLFAIGLFALVDYFMWDGTIPFYPRYHLEYPWLGAFYLGLFIVYLVFGAFSRALGVWLGLRLRRA
ncbi:hypothetical protein HNR46_004230 [Haloferula luteola]|uniref:Uncharacterized protein n=1 Tax=Haloferula luteola TaxID=595692 RepID=A0A840VJJ4_9BACT|nr:hypothetical protein [Haloferula luteola]